MELFKALRLLGDEGRVRILRLLAQDELSVADLQEILGMGQSRISMQLSQLKSARLVDVRRLGRKSLYRASDLATEQTIVAEVIRRSRSEIPSARRDDLGLELVCARRKDRMRGHFDELAGRFGRHYLPGRSWRALTQALMRAMPPLDIADLGAGEGTLALMLARRAKSVIAVDNSARMVAYGRAVAERGAAGTIDYRFGEMEALPIDDESVDLALMHQVLHHCLRPAAALAEARRILRPGGRIVILDLLRHDIEAARELYADVHLGFSLAELHELLSAARFVEIEAEAVDREQAPPHFETVLAMAARSGSGA